VRLLFDFECVDGHVEEHFVSSDIREVECPHCPNPAQRIQSPVRSALDPVSGDFKKATGKWMKSREQKLKQERKANS
tara:strand:+ start:259 stop:489 length:231 start_codon:yes stop_codon:yes gene_type:complete